MTACTRSGSTPCRSAAAATMPANGRVAASARGARKPAPTTTSRNTRQRQQRRDGGMGERAPYHIAVNEPRELTEIEARSVQRPPSEEADQAERRSVYGRWVPSRTLVLVMPGRGTLARRNGRLGRTVWSTTTNRSGRSVERPLECRGRLVWRTRRRWGRSVSVAAPGEPGGGAIARGDHGRMGVDVGRARILRSATDRRRRACADRSESGTTSGLARFDCSRVALKADCKRGVRARDQAGPS